MFDRPRCRDWSPLISQQLRLRNLIQISGHNIVCDAKTSLYYTLHFTSMSAPFFTSEKLETSKNAIWPEINCQSIIKSTAKCICVRVWQRSRIINVPPGQQNSENKLLQISTKTKSLSTSLRQNNKISNDDDHHLKIETCDKVLFLWGVYFSGLVPISKRTDVELKDNSLIFQMHGGFFTSADCLSSQNVAKQLFSIGLTIDQQEMLDVNLNNNQLKHCKQKEDNINNNCDHLDISSNNNNISSRNTNSTLKIDYQNIDLIVKNDNSQKLLLDSMNIVNHHHQSAPPCPSASTTPPTIRSSNHHNTYNVDVKSFTNDQYQELNTHLLRIRFIEKNFYKSEIRPSYNVEKLLALQEKQRKIKYKSVSAKQVMDKICMKSAFCLNVELFTNKTTMILRHPQGNPSMGRTLNRLLFQQPEQPKPEILMKSQELRQKIETARFRCRLLCQERNRIKHSIRCLEINLLQLSDENIEQQSWLMENYRGLSRDKDLYHHNQQKLISEREHLHSLLVLTDECRQQLLRALKEIYCIESISSNRTVYTINGIVLPDAESYSSIQSPTSLSVVLGYVAHILLMCSIILNVPLRNTIIYKGSASKIRDDVRDSLEQYREFPLYCRSLPPPDTLAYAVFLLNQNISQFKHMLRLTKNDLRATLPNLLQLLNGIPKDTITITTSTSTSTPTTTTIKNQDIINAESTIVRVTENFKRGEHAKEFNSISGSSSTDLNVPLPTTVNLIVSKGDKIRRGESRISRSVESFTDEYTSSQDTQIRKSRFNSEPILFGFKDAKLAKATATINICLLNEKENI